MRYPAAKRKSDPFSRTSWQYLMHHNQPLDALNILNNILEQENLGRDKVNLLMNRAICYERLGNFEKAEQEFKKLRASNPNHPKSALSYAKFLEDRGRDSEALKEYQFLNERKHLFDTPDYRKQNIGSSIQIGYERVLKRLDQTKKAKQLRAEFKKTEGPNERIMLQEAFNVQKEADLTRAQQLFYSVCKQFPSSVKAWLGYLRCLVLDQKFKQALAVIKKLTLPMQSNAEILLAWGRCLQDTGDYEGAVNRFSKGLQLHPDDDNLRIALLRCYEYLGDMAEAQRIALTLSPVVLKDPKVLNTVALCLIKAGDFKQARRYLEQDKKQIFANLSLIKLYAWCLENMNEQQQALTMLAKLYQDKPQQAELAIAYGSHLRNVGLYMDANQVFIEAAKRNPDNIAIIIAHAYCLSHIKSHEEAISLIKDKYSPENKEPAIGLCYSKCLQAKNSYQEAITVLAELRVRFPHDAQVAGDYVQCLLKNPQREDGIIATIYTVYKKFPQDIHIILAYATVLKEQKEYQQAKVFLQQHKTILLSRDPDVALTTVKYLEQMRDLREDDVTFIRERFKYIPKIALHFHRYLKSEDAKLAESTYLQTPQMALEYADLLKQEGKIQDQVNVLTSAYKKFTLSYEVVIRYLSVLKKIKNYHLLCKIGKEAAENFPQNINIQLRYVALLYKQNEVANATELLRLLKTRHPNNVEVHLSEAFLLKKEGKWVEALTMMQKLYKDMPNDQRVLQSYTALLLQIKDYMAVITIVEKIFPQFLCSIKENSRINKFYLNYIHCLINMGNYSRALEQLSILKQYAPKNLEVAKTYAFCLEASGDFAAAAMEYQALHEQFPQDLEITLQYAISLEKNNMPKPALELLSQLKAVFPDNFGIEISYARCLVENKKTTEAIAYYDELLKIYPGNAIIICSLAYSLIRNHEFNTSVALLKQCMESKDSASVEVGLKLANIYFIGGELQLAEDLYDKLLQDYPSDLSVISDYMRFRIYMEPSYSAQTAQYINKYIQQYPFYIDFRLHKLDMLLSYKHHKKAEKFVKACIDQCPGHHLLFKRIQEIYVTYRVAPPSILTPTLTEPANVVVELKTESPRSKSNAFASQVPLVVRSLCYLFHSKKIEYAVVGSAVTQLVWNNAYINRNGNKVCDPVSKGIISSRKPIIAKDVDLVVKLTKAQLEELLSTTQFQVRPSLYIPQLFVITSQENPAIKIDVVLVGYDKYRTFADIERDITMTAIHGTFAFDQAPGRDSDRAPQITGLIVDDPHDGIVDLKAGKIRMVGDARASFTKEPIRMLRAVLAHIKFDMQLDEKLPSVIKATAPLLSNYKDPGHLADYVLRLFSCRETERMFTLCVDFGLWDVLFLQSNGLSAKSFPQDFLQEIKSTCREFDEYSRQHNYQCAHNLLSYIVDRLTAAQLLIDRNKKETTIGQLKLLFAQYSENIINNLPLDARDKEKIKAAQPILHHSPAFTKFFRTLTTKLKIAEPAITSSQPIPTLVREILTVTTDEIIEQKLARDPLPLNIPHIINQQFVANKPLEPAMITTITKQMSSLSEYDKSQVSSAIVKILSKEKIVEVLTRFIKLKIWDVLFLQPCGFGLTVESFPQPLLSRLIGFCEEFDGYRTEHDTSMIHYLFYQITEILTAATIILQTQIPTASTLQSELATRFLQIIVKLPFDAASMEQIKALRSKITATAQFPKLLKLITTLLAEKQMKIEDEDHEKLVHAIDRLFELQDGGKIDDQDPETTPTTQKKSTPLPPLTSDDFPPLPVIYTDDYVEPDQYEDDKERECPFLVKRIPQQSFFYSGPDKEFSDTVHATFESLVQPIPEQDKVAPQAPVRAKNASILALTTKSTIPSTTTAVSPAASTTPVSSKVSSAEEFAKPASVAKPIDVVAETKSSAAPSKINRQKKRRQRKSKTLNLNPTAPIIEIITSDMIGAQDKPKRQTKLEILLQSGDQQVSKKKFIEAKKSYTEAYRLCTKKLTSSLSIGGFEDLARVQERFHDLTEDDQLFSYFMKKYAHTLTILLPKLKYLLASKYHHLASFFAQSYLLSFLNKDQEIDKVEIEVAESDYISTLLDVEKLIFAILQTVAIDVTDFNSLQISKRFKEELKTGESLLIKVMTWIRNDDPLRKPLQDTKKVVQTLQTQTLTTVKKIAAMPLGQTFNKPGNNNALAVNVLKYILKNFKLLLPQFIKTDGLQDLFLQPKPLALLDVVNVSLKFIQQIDQLQWNQLESKDIPGKQCFALATLLFNIMQYRHYYEAEFMKQINTHMPNTITIADQVPAEFWRLLLMAAFKQGVASPRLAILATLLCSKTKGELLTLKLTGDIIAASSSTKAQEYYQRAAEYKLNFTSSATQALSSVNEMLAQCHSLCQLKEYDKAAALCAKALSVYPYHFKLHIMQAEIYSRIDPDKALDMCNEILQIQPNEFDTHKIMGNSYLQKGEYQKAEAQYLRILKNEAKLGGKENDTVLRLAEVYMLAKCYVQAIRTYLTLFLPSTATFVAILDDKPIPAAVLDIEGICAFIKHKASSKIIKTLLEQEKLAIVKIGECLQQLDYKEEAQAISQLIPATDTPATHAELVLKRKDSLFVLPGADSSAASSSSLSISGTSSTLQAL